jgi:hypothetical protein
MFSAVIHLPEPQGKFEKLIAVLETAVVEASEESMEDAVKEAVKGSDTTTDVRVAINGRWKQ